MHCLLTPQCAQSLDMHSLHTPTHSTSWHALPPHTPVCTTSWHALSLHTPTHSTSWHALPPHTPVCTTSWHALSLHTPTHATSWHALSPHTPVCTFWHALSLHTPIHSTSWHALSLHTPTHSTSWHALSLYIPVCTTSWHALPLRTPTHSTSWHALSPHTPVCTTSWHALPLHTPTHSASWLALSPYTPVCTTSWHGPPPHTLPSVHPAWSVEQPCVLWSVDKFSFINECILKEVTTFAWKGISCASMGRGLSSQIVLSASAKHGLPCVQVLHDSATCLVFRCCLIDRATCIVVRCCLIDCQLYCGQVLLDWPCHLPCVVVRCCLIDCSTCLVLWSGVAWLTVPKRQCWRYDKAWVSLATWCAPTAVTSCSTIPGTSPTSVRWWAALPWVTWTASCTVWTRKSGTTTLASPPTTSLTMAPSATRGSEVSSGQALPLCFLLQGCEACSLDLSLIFSNEYCGQPFDTELLGLSELLHCNKTVAVKNKKCKELVMLEYCDSFEHLKSFCVKEKSCS